MKALQAERPDWMKNLSGADLANRIRAAVAKASAKAAVGPAFETSNFGS